MPSADISEPAHNYPSPSHLSSETPNLRSSFALSRQIQDLEQEIGFRLFDRLPRGVKMSEAGNLFLNDARRILQEVNDAAARAKRVACGLAGTLRIGFVESISWHGIIPDSIRDFRERRPDAEVQLIALSSLEQIAAIQSGSLDAGYAVPLVNPDHGLAHFQVGIIKTILAVPKGHAVAKRKKIRLRDLVDYPSFGFRNGQSPMSTSA